MKELKVVALMGTILTKDELEEFMAEADSVSIIVRKMMYQSTINFDMPQYQALLLTKLVYWLNID